eukprot:maker-scaffold_1-snap-gene-8.7-mRNA-1 protein AED:0.03 eAED:0.03 QI:210/1/1/1/1/1/4/99/507
MDNNIYIAHHTFTAQEAADISIQKNELIFVVNKDPSGWWTGKNRAGQAGLFPNTFVVEYDTSFGDRVLDFQIVESTTEGEAFDLTLKLASGKSLRGTMQTGDFKVFATAAKYFNPSTPDYTIPAWAEQCTLLPVQVKERLQLLDDILREGMNSLEVEFLIAHWIGRGAEFNVEPTVRSNVSSRLSNAKHSATPSEPRPDIFAVVQYGWDKREEGELTLIAKETIAVLEQDTRFQGWSTGQTVNGRKGIYVSEYVRVLTDDVEIRRFLNGSTGYEPPAPIVNTGINLLISQRFDEVRMEDSQLPLAGAGTENKGRFRKVIVDYSLPSTGAFDFLLEHGMAVIVDGKLLTEEDRRNLRVSNRRVAGKGDVVTMEYNAYLWEPQEQKLLEFLSSDLLINDTSQDASEEEVWMKSGIPLKFKIGAEQVIEGLEQAVSFLTLEQQASVIVTPEKGYGDIGAKPLIPGDAFLMYNVVIKEINSHKSASGEQDGVYQGVARPHTKDHLRSFKGF